MKIDADKVIKAWNSPQILDYVVVCDKRHADNVIKHNGALMPLLLRLNCVVSSIKLISILESVLPIITELFILNAGNVIKESEVR